jgi:opacity protein-like surface antigen
VGRVLENKEMKKALLLLAVLGLSTTAAAQQNSRDDTWEFALIIQDTSGDDLRGENGSAVSVEGDTGWGVALNYNFNSHLSLGGELIWGSPDYDALLIPDDGIGIPEQISHELSIFQYAIKGTFNLIDGPLTPYAELGFGWANIDSNIADQPPITGCWWDPWWGYVCDTFYSTYDKTRTYYSGALGLRWDLNNGMTLKGSYGITEVDVSKATSKPSLEVLRLDIAWRF